MSTMITQGEIPREMKEDLVKILTYIASGCLFIILIFTLIYIGFPSISEDYTSFPAAFPLSGFISRIMFYLVHSITNLFTYIFLTIVGIVSFLGAQQFEEELLESQNSSSDRAQESGKTTVALRTLDDREPEPLEGSMKIAGSSEIKGIETRENNEKEANRLQEARKARMSSSKPAAEEKTTERSQEEVEREKAMSERLAEKLASTSDPAPAEIKAPEAAGAKQPDSIEREAPARLETSAPPAPAADLPVKAVMPAAKEASPVPPLPKTGIVPAQDTGPVSQVTAKPAEVPAENPADDEKKAEARQEGGPIVTVNITSHELEAGNSSIRKQAAPKDPTAISRNIGGEEESK